MSIWFRLSKVISTKTISILHERPLTKVDGFFVKKIADSLHQKEIICVYFYHELIQKRNNEKCTTIFVDYYLF